MNMIRNYYNLAKPGIIYGNSITAIAGFFLASRMAGNGGLTGINWFLLFAMLIGLGLVMGGACVFNNYIDSDIDIKMERTKTRATVTGAISKPAALAYGIVLTLLGFFILWKLTTMTAFVVAAVGIAAYVGWYTPSKRRTSYSTLIGSISGATPPVVGFCAVTGVFNLEAFILFLIFAFWQMPHFYAIGIYRVDDYAAAGVPIVPIKRGIRTAKSDIILYICAFVAAALLLTSLGYAGYVYATVIVILGLIWLWMGVQGFRRGVDDKKWARKMFVFSLIAVTVTSAAIAFLV